MNLYEHHYTELNFERAGLFKTIRDNYRCKDVLYPGCSVHITPSLYFSHVVYVDQSETATKFFANEKAVAEFVDRKKRYKPPAYIRFIQQDYFKPLPLPEKTFDLLLSLFTGGIARSCARYLKPGGLLLTNDHQDDAREAVKDEGFKLTAKIRFQKGNYVITEDGLDGIKIFAQKRNKQYLKQANQGMEYIENEVYYVLQRRRGA